MSAKAMTKVLEYCYTGHASLARGDVESGAELLQAVHILMLPSVFQFAEAALCEAVTPHSAPALYVRRPRAMCVRRVRRTVTLTHALPLRRSTVSSSLSTATPPTWRTSAVTRC